MIPQTCKFIYLTLIMLRIIDGVTKLSGYGDLNVQDIELLETLNAFQIYDFQILWKDQVLGAHLNLYWEDSANMVIIPPENFITIHDFGNSPYQIKIGCEDGYRQVSDPNDR